MIIKDTRWSGWTNRAHQCTVFSMLEKGYAFCD